MSHLEETQGSSCNSRDGNQLSQMLVELQALDPAPDSVTLAPLSMIPYEVFLLRGCYPGSWHAM